MEHSYDDLMRALDVLYICALMVENDIWEEKNCNYAMDLDHYWEVMQDALWTCCEYAYSKYDEENDVEHLYFSTPVMLEYYRLCREYGSRRSMRLKDNPYYISAGNYVRSMISGGYTSDYILHTKVNHRCASGIHFLHDSYFEGQIDLLEGLINIVRFYENGVKELKAELAKSTSLVIIKPSPAFRPILKEAA
jgi:hypothetical protein